MHWEKIEDGLYRSRVTGGWIVKLTNEVMTKMHEDMLPTEGYEWRESICFVPDSERNWEIA